MSRLHATNPACAAFVNRPTPCFSSCARNARPNRPRQSRPPTPATPPQDKRPQDEDRKVKRPQMKDPKMKDPKTKDSKMKDRKEVGPAILAWWPKGADYQWGRTHSNS